MVRSRTVVGAVALAGVLAATAVPAHAVERRPRAQDPLRVTVHCTEDGTELELQWRADRLGTTYSLETSAQPWTADTVVDTGPLTVQATGWQEDHWWLESQAGPARAALRAGGEVVSEEQLDVPDCDGWPGISAFAASSANRPGSPLAVGALTGVVTRGPDGTTAAQALDGDVVAERDGTTHVVRGPVSQYWRATGGLGGRLGAPTTSQVENSEGTGFSTQFTSGAVWWSPATGAHSLKNWSFPYGVGTEGTRWAPGLGFPTDDGTDVRAGDGSTFGWYQRFSEGVNYSSVAGAGFVANGAVLGKYAETGYERGRLGWPVSSGEAFAYGDGSSAADPYDSWRQRFQNGAIYAPFDGGPYPAHVLYGAIAARYQGGNDRTDFRFARALGYPVSDEIATADGTGAYAVFSNRAGIYWSPASGAHEVVDAGYGFNGYYAYRGGPTSRLGYPTAPQVALTLANRFGSTGAVQQFTGGNLYARWDPATRDHQRFSVTGAFYPAWAARGWEGSDLGYPTSEEFSVNGGVRQTFEGGRLDWDQRTQRVTVTLT